MGTRIKAYRMYYQDLGRAMSRSSGSANGGRRCGWLSDGRVAEQAEVVGYESRAGVRDIRVESRCGAVV